MSSSYYTRNGIDWASLNADLLTVESNGAGAFDVIARRRLPEWEMMPFLEHLATRPNRRTALGYADALGRARGIATEDWT